MRVLGNYLFYFCFQMKCVSHKHTTHNPPTHTQIACIEFACVKVWDQAHSHAICALAAITIFAMSNRWNGWKMRHRKRGNVIHMSYERNGEARFESRPTAVVRFVEQNSFIYIYVLPLRIQPFRVVYVAGMSSGFKYFYTIPHGIHFVHTTHFKLSSPIIGSKRKQLCACFGVHMHALLTTCGLPNLCERTTFDNDKITFVPSRLGFTVSGARKEMRFV